jgi:hypothetical protein
MNTRNALPIIRDNPTILSPEHLFMDVPKLLLSYQTVRLYYWHINANGSTYKTNLKMRFATEELQEFTLILSKNLHYFFELRVHR